MSAMPIGAPGCPEFAAWTASMLKARIALARSRRLRDSVGAAFDVRSVILSSSGQKLEKLKRAGNLLVVLVIAAVYAVTPAQFACCFTYVPGRPRANFQQLVNQRF